jgi:hypothetical protein
MLPSMRVWIWSMAKVLGVASAGAELRRSRASRRAL